MDTVRFGRALGFGARQAAKTVIRAVDAARAENPSAPTPATRSASAATVATSLSPAGPFPRTPSPAVVHPAVASQPQRRNIAPLPDAGGGAQSAARSAVAGPVMAGGLKQGLHRFRDSTVEPVVRLSGVLWLEVTGVFFGIFALSTAVAAWRLRSQWRAAIGHPTQHGSLLIAVALFALFAYFCVSSFVRARRRERRRS